MIVIGEKINGTRQEVAIAIKNRDSGYIRELALSQVKAGANYLDINAGTHPSQEPQDMEWLVEIIQECTDIKLCLDSANSNALLAGIKKANQLPMINSLSGENRRIKSVLPLACEYKTELVVLALDDDGIPKTAQKRLEIIERLIKLTRKSGLLDNRLYIDPLVTTIATDNNSGVTAFETIRKIRNAFPEAHITCGLSNISFGQPCRTIINQAFAAQAIGVGMDSAIIDPLDFGLRNAVYSAELVMGLDIDCLNYNQSHRAGLIVDPLKNKFMDNGKISKAFRDLSSALTASGIIKESAGGAEEIECNSQNKAEPQVSDDDEIETFIISLVDMKKARVLEMTKTLLAKGTNPLSLLDASKKAMTEVGRLFETQEYFVPELILAGRMLKDISQLIKPYMKTKEEFKKNKGRVIIGTVEGDIHDIGKDIVVTMLEVNGYEVMDLGVDVPVLKFIEATQSFNPGIIGLSGFLTLAYDPMKETIAKIKQAGFKDIKFMLGGGQIDEQVRVYAGADAFGRDAMEAVKLCDQWMGN
ncbi:dihydropteroate synthase [Desulfobacula sp.]|uniref:dihydropteroate synthase n=1 Tax=Desulfobacula sp. TaxID=2593537 RepID=UPI0025C24DCB|nr:dihydropteroate synthase [Desulfobacula sp.]